MEKSKNKRNKNHKLLIPCIIACLFIIAAGIYCWHRDPSQFWSFNIANCLTLLVAVLFSFFYSQKQAANDRDLAELRKKKEAAIRLLTALEETVRSPSAFDVSHAEGTESLTMAKRRMSNYIDTLKRNSSEFGIEEEIKHIEDKFLEYSDLIGNHIDDLDHLKKSQKDLQRPLEIIETKIYDLIFILCK